MSPTRRTSLAAAVVLAGAGTALAVVPASADEPLRLVTVAAPDRNTDLDLGARGPSAGDTQVFLDDVQRDGETVGTSAGSCTVAALSKTRLAAACATTLTLPEGQITTQGAFDEDPTVGPAGFTWAVTGGTGRYAGAGGEVTGTLRPGTDTVDLEVRFR